MSRARDAATWEVYINQELDPLAQVIRVEEHINGRMLDTAILDVDPKRLEVDGIATSVRSNMTPEVIIACKFDGKTYYRHWGKLAEIEPHVDPEGMRVRITSRMENWHFSVPLSGPEMVEPIKKTRFRTNRELVFNPTIDGITEGNCSPATPTGDSPNYFIDPESVRTPTALKLHGNKAPVKWTLPKAVHYLCKSLNHEFYVNSPSYEGLLQVFDDDTALIRNITMPDGFYLAQCLDRLLIPLGYLWYIGKNGSAFNEFVFLKKGTGGRAKQAKHQKRGETFDNKSSEADNITLRYDLTKLANHVWAFGSPERVEFTAECVRTWSADKDDLTSEELYLGLEDFEDVQDVYRKWVIDTAGDYTETRPENKTKRFDLAALFDNINQIPGRRKLGPCLTLGADGAPVGQVQGVYVEYSNPLYVDGGDEPEWLPVQSSGCTLMEKEAGVYFAGDFVPDEILQQGTSARIRITATLDSDLRTFADVRSPGTSPNSDDVWLPLDMPDRFIHHRLQAGQYRSRFYDDVVNKVRTADTHSDGEIIEEFAGKLLKTFDAAEISGPVVLHGCDYDFKLGDRITAIPGLGLDLLCNPADFPLQYPQIAAITYEPQDQKTTLQLQRFRSDVTPPEASPKARRRKR